MRIPTSLGKANYYPETYPGVQQEVPTDYTPRLSRGEHAAVSTTLASLTKTERVIVRAIVEAAGHVYKKPGEEVDSEVYREPSNEEIAERTGKSEDAARRHIKSVKEKTRAQLPEKKPPTGRVKHPALAAVDAHLNEIDMRLTVQSTESVPPVKEKKRRSIYGAGMGGRPKAKPEPRPDGWRGMYGPREVNRLEKQILEHELAGARAAARTPGQLALHECIRRYSRIPIQLDILMAWSEGVRDHHIAIEVAAWNFKRTTAYVRRLVERFCEAYKAAEGDWRKIIPIPKRAVKASTSYQDTGYQDTGHILGGIAWGGFIYKDPRTVSLSRRDLFDTEAGNRSSIDAAFEQASSGGGDTGASPSRDMRVAEPVVSAESAAEEPLSAECAPEADNSEDESY